MECSQSLPNDWGDIANHSKAQGEDSIANETTLAAQNGDYEKVMQQQCNKATLSRLYIYMNINKELQYYSLGGLLTVRHASWAATTISTNARMVERAVAVVGGRP